MTDRRPHPETGQRVTTPPHDEQAERALLGAALATHPAATAALAALDPADFYRPGNGHIAAAITALNDRGEPADAITVAAELDRAGLLTAAGGPALLVEYSAGGGIASNAQTYAELIAGHARTRRVMYVAEEILARGYQGVPAADLVNLATRRLDDLPTSTGSTLQWADIAALLAGGIPPTETTDLLARTDGRCLLYGGRIHFLQGEPGTGKGWVALAAANQLLTIGAPVVYLDLEDTDAGILGRLLSLGANPNDLTNLLHLVRPTGPFTVTEIADLEHRAQAANPELIIIDGLGEALAGDGLDENSNTDVTTWLRRIPRRLAHSTGAAIIIIDHVVKSSEDRGRYARGAGAKLAALDGVAYKTVVRQSWSRVGPVDGQVDLIIAKDRHGAVGPTDGTAAHVHLHVDAAGGLVHLRIEPPTADETRGLPVNAMVRASTVIEANPGLSTTQLMTHRKPFGVPAFQRAIDALTDGGYIERHRKGNGHTYTHLRGYPDGDPVEPAAPDFGDF